MCRGESVPLATVLESKNTSSTLLPCTQQPRRARRSKLVQVHTPHVRHYHKCNMCSRSSNMDQAHTPMCQGCCIPQGHKGRFATGCRPQGGKLWAKGPKTRNTTHRRTQASNSSTRAIPWPHDNQCTVSGTPQRESHDGSARCMQSVDSFAREKPPGTSCTPQHLIAPCTVHGGSFTVRLQPSCATHKGIYKQQHDTYSCIYTQPHIKTASARQPACSF